MKESARLFAAVVTLICAVLLVFEAYDFGQKVATAVGYGKFAYFFILLVCCQFLNHLLKKE